MAQNYNLNKIYLKIERAMIPKFLYAVKKQFSSLSPINIRPDFHSRQGKTQKFK